MIRQVTGYDHRKAQWLNVTLHVEQCCGRGTASPNEFDNHCLGLPRRIQYIFSLMWQKKNLVTRNGKMYQCLPISLKSAQGFPTKDRPKPVNAFSAENETGSKNVILFSAETET